MEEWKEYKLEEIGKITTGKTPKTAIKENFGGSIFFVSPSDINTPYKYVSETDRYLTEEGLNSIASNSIEEGSICVSCIGNLGYVGIVKQHCASNQQINSITVNEEHNRDFIYYSIKNLWPFFKSYEGQSTALSILNKGQFSKISIKCPSLNTQTRIASILSSLDDKIECNRRINENLEQQAQALFKSWFVDFEPFKDQPFVEYELGMIPQGWKVSSFIELINVMPGGTPSTGVSEYWDNATIPFFSPKDANGVYCFDTEKHISEIGLNNCSSHLYPKDTLFITARGTVGKIALAAVPMAMNQSNYALVGKEGIGKFYLYLLTQTIVTILLKKANGAVFSAITTKDFKEDIVCPPFGIISSFEKKIKPMFDKIHSLMSESRRLAELRDALLPKLMSGEINVDNITI